MRARLVAAGLAATLSAAACGNGSGSDGSGGGEQDARATPPGGTVTPSESLDVPSALDDMRHERFPEPLVDPAEVRSGGPPPDGIPAIDEPKFLSVDEVDFLDDREPVLAIDVNGDARAYPIQVMTWHEIANDTVGGVPVTVSYCPLCNTAVAYDRRVDDMVLDFGTSGRLYNSALVMYDRQTESLWSHFTGQAIIGHLTGTTLELIPVQTVAWKDWRAANPDGLVLSRDTGHSRDYGRNPYPGYDDVDNPPFLFDGEVDGRYAAKTRVLGVRDGDAAVAIVHDHLREERVVELELAGRPIVAWLLPGTASGLDASSIDEGRDVGATGVFDRTVDAQVLTFEPAGDTSFRDRETGSVWNVLGEAIEGPLAGRALTPVEHVDTFWFAWGAFVPESDVID